MRRYDRWHGLGLMTSCKIVASLWLIMICLVAAEDVTTPLYADSSEETSPEFLSPEPILSSDSAFKNGDQPVNTMYLAGTPGILHCEIDMELEDNVAWVYKNPKSAYPSLLTFGKFSVSNDRRISLSFQDPWNFRLMISYIKRRDQGLYECQVSTTEAPSTPKKVMQVFLKVLDPEVIIKDKNSQMVSECEYKAGSNVEFTCVASHLDLSDENITWWKEGLLVQEGVRYKSESGSRTIESTLVLHHAQPLDSGNYTCSVDNLASASVFVNILNTPEVIIKDQRNRVVTERYYMVGSAVELTCLASQVETPRENITWWRGEVPILEGVSYISNVEHGSIESTLMLHNAQRHHSGNYTCRLNNLTSASVPVHVLSDLQRVYYYVSRPSIISTHTP
ncbi:protein sidekick-like isoform X1 [Homalodisca vitripennis]|uniref:protein sidekick-like isoform X1 n=2 Tax=Homalodisca vitripennis TaxID=197043 RepID=UPI001EEC8041|nr:protein sidekick-like isoform X1 [Homalodisca vitripennis]